MCEVEYCLNAACVNPKFLGSPAFGVVPRLQGGVWPKPRNPR